MRDYRRRIRRRRFPARRRGPWMALLLLLAVGIFTAGVLSLFLPEDEKTGSADGTFLHAPFRSAAQKRVDALEKAAVPDWISQEFIPSAIG